MTESEGPALARRRDPFGGAGLAEGILWRLRRSVLARPARMALSAILRALPLISGERGLQHADWRAHHWAPEWLHAEADRVRALRSGIFWTLDLRDNVQRSLYYTGRYEQAIQRLLARASGPGAVLVDIGAHIGVHALRLARHYERVVAFEPSPDSAAKLRQAALRTGIRNVHVVETALGSKAENVALRANPAFGISDAGVRSRYGLGAALFDVPVTVFDEWFERAGIGRVDAVKIDVEGAELDVLHGMKRTLALCRPRVLVIELLEKNLLQARATPGDVRTLLQESGYIASRHQLERSAVFVPASC